MANAFKCDRCGSFFELQPLRNFIGGDRKDNVQANLRLFMLDKHGDKYCEFEQWDLCPECYKKLRQFLNPKVENVQSENNTDCFEKEITQEEALKLMQETWCYKCKFFNKVVCMKKIKNLDESCFYDFMNNEVPRNFRELPIPIQEFENGGNENEN